MLTRKYSHAARSYQTPVDDCRMEGMGQPKSAMRKMGSSSESRPVQRFSCIIVFMLEIRKEERNQTHIGGFRSLRIHLRRLAPAVCYCLVRAVIVICQAVEVSFTEAYIRLSALSLAAFASSVRGGFMGIPDASDGCDGRDPLHR